MNNSFARINLAVACIVLWCGGCATDGIHRDPAQPADALFKADRDFALYAQQHGVANAFREFAAPEALQLPMGEAPIHGRAAIFRAMSDFPPGELRWRPVGADLARSGDLGYTWGTYEFRPRGAGGQSETRHGKYVTVWKKQRDGSWKFVVDTGNASPAPD
jgi:ketosteroid isomerase-like protein